MYELYIDQELVFPDGSSMKSDELSDTPYAILKKVPCVIDVSKGITMAFSPLGPLAETFGIDVSQDDEKVVSELNAIRSAEYANSKLKAMTYSSVVSAAKFFAVSLPDEQAIEVADLYPEYEVDHAYKQNDRFQYNGSLYKVNQDHTSQAQWFPESPAPSRCIPISCLMSRATRFGSSLPVLMTLITRAMLCVIPIRMVSFISRLSMVTSGPRMPIRRAGRFIRRSKL